MSTLSIIAIKTYGKRSEEEVIGRNHPYIEHGGTDRATVRRKFWRYGLSIHPEFLVLNMVFIIQKIIWQQYASRIVLLIPDVPLVIRNHIYLREKGRDLTQSYDKSQYTNRNVIRAKWQHKQRHKKSSITQRLRTDFGRSVGVTTATQMVWLTWFTGPTSPLPATTV